MNTQMRILNQQITRIQDQLTKSDHKVLSFLEEFPMDFAQMSITDIAKQADVSVAAVTRLARKLGYEKLQDLKMSVSLDLQISSPTEYKNISKDDSYLAISKKVLQRNQDAISDLTKIVKEEDLQKAVELLNQARRIIFVGLGGSASVGQDAYHKFLRLGLMVELISDVHVQVIASSVGSEEDVIVVISNEGSNRELNQALSIAKSNGMKVIAITQLAKSGLTKLADVCLYTLPRKLDYKPESLISRIEEYSLIDVLYVEFCMKSDYNVEHQLKKISAQLKDFKNYEE